MTGTTVSTGNNINSGGTFVHCGASGNLNNINVNGGTLQVCGDVNISNLNFNSGVIHISQYGHLTVNGNLSLNNNCQIINYGRLDINGNLSFQNNNNYLYNARTDASVMVTGSISFPTNLAQNSYVVNKGYINAGTFTITDGLSVCCFESGSYLAVSVFSMSVSGLNNPVTFGSASGSATIRYTTSASLGGASKSLTASSSIIFCRATGAGAASGSGNTGSATLATGCAALVQPVQTGVVVTCYTLPVEWLSFGGSSSGRQIALDWATATEESNDYFSIEMSRNGAEYISLARIAGAGNSTQRRDYSYSWTAPDEGDYYFRIRQVDFNGQSDYSRMIVVTVQADEDRFGVFPNPFSEILTVVAPAENYTLVIWDGAGRAVQTVTLREGETQIGTSQLEDGLYSAVIFSASGEIKKRTLLSKAGR
jgi:hypothetical protein